ncbi:hypothetical protein C6A86_023540 [Mycobacterium sp. ITM-2016-00316]|uniref:hypothetical protein n=1 Tax=Mycobacterium sp. ITM-2016-00316 TaxID=2099695 RepID=UPI000CF9D740|nr:hypothetical protein [Mycobacterium sp. ITM-2016-00316]WNG81135.1 hypothetical protein C6A86_023540 [Mycobacterium sp. ITM-2016-00316]
MGHLRWVVVIETRSNQALVFRTNKQLLNVSASRLIWSVGFEWIPAATDDEHVEHVGKASGLGVLLATPEVGRKIIEAVTTRAVREAPDLEV